MKIRSLNIRKRLRPVCFLLAVSLLPGEVSFALAPRLASVNPMAKREIRAVLERTRVVYAESDEAKALLRSRNAEALLLNDGKYLVTKDVADDPLRLIRAIVHEDIEALMQVIANEDRYTYSGIKELILNDRAIRRAYFDLSYGGVDPGTDRELLLNDIVARSLEIMFVAENGFLVAENIRANEISEKEARFYFAIKPVIMAKRHNYFRDGLFITREDAHRRGEKIRKALSSGITFFRVSSAKPRSAVGTPEKIFRYLTLPENIGRSFTRAEIATGLGLSGRYIEKGYPFLIRSGAIRESGKSGREPKLTASFVDAQSAAEIQAVLDNEFGDIGAFDREKALLRVTDVVRKRLDGFPEGLSKEPGMRHETSRIYEFLTRPENLGNSFTAEEIAVSLGYVKGSVFTRSNFLRKCLAIDEGRRKEGKKTFFAPDIGSENIALIQAILDEEFAVLTKADLGKAAARIMDVVERSAFYSEKRPGKGPRFARSSRADIVPKIVTWKKTGAGFDEGDYVIADVNLGGDWVRQEFTDDGETADFSLDIPPGEGAQEEVLFIAESDINHGLVLNAYTLAEYQSKLDPEPCATYKYFPGTREVRKISLAAYDIAYTARGSKKIHSLKRAFRTKIADVRMPLVHIGIPVPEFAGADKVVQLYLPKEEVDQRGLRGKDAVIMVENDPNHGQVINVYAEEDHKKIKKERIPLRTFKYFQPAEGKAPKKGLAQFPLGVMDIMSAYAGNVLSVYGRTARSKVVKDNYGSGAVYLWAALPGKPRNYVKFGIPRSFMEKGAYGKSVIIKVEKDINQGQVINLYFEEEYFGKEGKAIPVITYKYHPGKERGTSTGKVRKGVCKSIDIAARDIGAYYGGDHTIKPVDGREFEMPVNWVEGKDGPKFRAESTLLSEGKRIIFHMLPAAGKHYSVDDEVRRAVARLADDRDYGTYIDVSKDGETLARYYYFDELKDCTSADFSRMALIDHALGRKNRYGEYIGPREYRHEGRVTADNRLQLTYRGRELVLKNLPDNLRGKQVVLVPEKNADHGFIINIHDAEELGKTRERKPDAVMIRSSEGNTYVHWADKELSEIRSLAMRGYVLTATGLLNRVKDKYAGSFTVDEIIRIIREKKAERDDILLRAGERTEEERVGLYLGLMADSVLFGNEDARERAAGYFEGVMYAPDVDKKGVINGLLRKLDLAGITCEGALLNAGIFRVLSGLPSEYKDMELARYVAPLHGYSGPYKDRVIAEGIKFLKSFPESGLKQPLTERANMPPPDNMDEIGYLSWQAHQNPRLKDLGEVVYGALSKCGDREARDTLVSSNLLLLIWASKRMSWLGLPYEDLVPEAQVGLTKAAHDYDPVAGTKFGTVAIVYINTAIRRFAQDNRSHIRIPVNQQMRMREFARSCRAKGIDPKDRNIEDAKISLAIGWTIEEVKDIREIQTFVIELDKAWDEDGETLHASFGRRDMGMDEYEMRDLIDTLIRRTEIAIGERWPVREEKESRIFVLHMRMIPMWRGLDFPTLEEVSQIKDPPVSGERIRQLENDIKDVVRSEFAAMGFSEKDLLGGDRSSFGLDGSPAEALRAIYKNYGFGEFSKKDREDVSGVYSLREPYASSTVDVEIRTLRKLGILIMVKPGVYRLNEFFRAATPEGTEENIRAVYNIKINTGKKAKPCPLDRYRIPASKIQAVREMVKIELFARGMLESLVKETPNKRVIKIWSGYAVTPEEKRLLQKMRDASGDKGIVIDPGNIGDPEDSIKELTDHAVSEEGRKDGTVIVIPFSHPYVRERIGELKGANVIFMEDRGGIDPAREYGELGGIIAAALAYIDRDAHTFSNMCRLLTGMESGMDLEELIKDPKSHIIVLEPAGKIDTGDLERLNERAQEALLSA